MDPAHYEISLFYIFATIFLVLLNGFFVAAEFAMVRVRGSQIEIRAKGGSGVAKVARGILHNLDGYLAATQLGITIASLALGVVGCPVRLNVQTWLDRAILSKSTVRPSPATENSAKGAWLSTRIGTPRRSPLSGSSRTFIRSLPPGTRWKK